MSEIIIHRVTKTSTSQLKARHHYTLDASKVPHAEATLDGQHLERGLYLSRSEVAAEHGETLLAITSMGPGEDAVVQQWRLIERTEMRKVPKPIERHLTIDLAKSTDPDFWRHLEAERDVPDCLSAFLEAGETRVRFIGKESEQIERFLRAHGWHDRTKKGKRAEITFHRGKQPIAQRRLVFELPGSLPPAAIERTINLLSQEFLKRNLPFVLVVHRPDEHNEKHNWHIHLDYHHRPMQRFDPKAIELTPLPADAGDKQRAQRRIMEEALASADPAWIGKWDSEIEYEYRTPSGKKKTAFPFVKEIHPDLREEGEWIRNLRTRYADIVNAELMRENLPDRFDPRSFEERNIQKIPDLHLSNSKSRFERSGRPTLEGATNEQCQWNYEVGELRKQFPGGDQSDSDPKAVAGFIAGYVDLLRARLRSRAEYINKFAKRETDWDRQPEPTMTSRRRNKNGDYAAYALEQGSQQMLSRLDRIWPALTKGLQDLCTRIQAVDSESPAKKTAASINQMKPSDAEADNRASDVRVVTVLQGKATDVRQPQAQNARTTPAVPVREDQPIAAAVKKLRAHSIPFAISMGSENGRKILVATIHERDAEAHKLPRQIVARSGQDRSDLMALQNERMDARAEAEAKTAPQSQPDLSQSPAPSNEAGTPASTESPGEPALKPDATASVPKSTDRSPEENLRGAGGRSKLEDEQSEMATSRIAQDAPLAKQDKSDWTANTPPAPPEPSLAGIGNVVRRPANERHSGNQDSPQNPIGNIARDPAPKAGDVEVQEADVTKGTNAEQLDLSQADRERMENRPIPLGKAGGREFRFLSIEVPQSLVAALNTDRHAAQFEGWYIRQESERDEIAGLFAQSSYANRMQLEAAVKDGDADQRLVELWRRWDGTPVLTDALDKGIGMRRRKEREVALEAKRKLELNRQIALNLGQGI